ncbi:carboxypeptidase-like regulatory domain-containing protein [Acidobacteriota bacterium]
MPGNQLFKSKGLIASVICAFLVLVVPVQVFAQAATGKMVGFVYEQDLGKPVQNAVVKIRSIDSRNEYKSNTTDQRGYYEMAGIPEGRYVLGVSVDGDNYNFEFEVYIKANETAQLSVALKEGASAVVGVRSDKAFFATPFGIALLALLGAGATIGTVALITGGEDTVSPSRR